MFSDIIINVDCALKKNISQESAKTESAKTRPKIY